MDGWVIVNFIEVDNYVGCIVTTIQALRTDLELVIQMRSKYFLGIQTAFLPLLLNARNKFLVRFGT